MSKSSQTLEATILALVDKHAHGGVLGVRKRSYGRVVVARCPFHKGGMENNPSFEWNLETGFFFCFTCRTQGYPPDFATLVQERELELPPEVLVPVPASSIKKKPVQDSQIIPEYYLASFSKDTPWKSTFPQDLLDEYEIGYDAGMQRTTIPIRTPDGRLVNVLGRAEAGQKPRYKYYFPGRPREVLWNFHRVWKQARNPYAPVIVVEGVRAALWLIWHTGRDILALLGSRIRDEQADLLALLSRGVQLMLDNDDAGREGSERAYWKLRKRGANVSIVELPQGKRQPDDLSPAELKDLLTKGGAE